MAYRACLFVSDDGQTTALTCEAQASLPDTALHEIARRNAGEVGLDVSSGELKVGPWTEQPLPPILF